MPVPTPRSRAPLPARRGALTRQAILELAMDLASVNGLEGLTIGSLAEAAGLSKSGLFAHFGSKEDLQLATVGAAREVFQEQVFLPALKVPRGLRRLCAMISAWIGYAENGPFRGGCFFAAAAAEFDGRPGPVKDLVADCMGEWRRALVRLAREAKEAGELTSSADPEQLAFEWFALAMGANGIYQLQADPQAFAMLRRAVRDRLKAHLPPGSRVPTL